MKEIKDLKLIESDKLAKLDAAKLKDELVRNEKNLFVLRMKKQTGELKQTHIIKFLRRYIARLKTLANNV